MEVDINVLTELSLEPIKKLQEEYIGKELILKDFINDMKERFNIEDKDIVYNEFPMKCTVQYEEDRYYVFKLKEEKTPYWGRKVITEIEEKNIVKPLPLADINNN